MNVFDDYEATGPHRYRIPTAVQHHSGSHINFQGTDWSQADQKWITGMLQDISKATAQKAEDRVRQLDIKEGDRVRLTVKNAPDPSHIEGKVIGVKDKDGQIQLRIEGFGHTGSTGGQHVWFVASNYSGEVLHRAYRWTPDDEIVVQIGGLTRRDWEAKDEKARQFYRDTYEARVERIKKILSDDANRG